MSKKQLSAAQGLEAACILFQINSKTADIINMASGAQMPEEYLSGPGAEMFCAEWRAFVHAVVTAAIMQHAPNTVFLAYLRQTGNLPVPLHLRNAPTKLMKQLGYGKDYKYAHAYQGNFVQQQFLPDEVKDSRIWHPQNNAQEAKIKERMQSLWGERFKE